MHEYSKFALLELRTENYLKLYKFISPSREVGCCCQLLSLHTGSIAGRHLMKKVNERKSEWGVFDA